MRNSKRVNWSDMSERQKISAIAGTASALARRRAKKKQGRKNKPLDP